jgi:hypothetical protein
MFLPIWASLLGLLGGVVLLPDHIDAPTRTDLDSRSYVIGSLGEAYNEQYFVYLPKSGNFPEVRAEGIYGGLSWASIEPRAAFTVSAQGDTWAGVGPSYTKYWQVGGDGNTLFIGANFLAGYADFSPGAAENNQFRHRSGILFRSQLEFGIITSERFRVSFYVDHRSNAGISYPNFGYDTAGINIGYSF